MLSVSSPSEPIRHTGRISTEEIPIHLSKVLLLSRGTAYDVCTSSASRRPSSPQRIGAPSIGGICHAFTPDGHCISLFKTLLTNTCTHGCYYCQNSSCSRSIERASYTPDELARLTLHLYRQNTIEGLFLSSAVGVDEERTMELMVETCEILRNRYHFGGYIHLKILPGASHDLIRRGIQWADRVSLNIETVSSSYLGELSPTKHYANDLLLVQRRIRDALSSYPLPAGHTTQLIVGGSTETDREIFERMLQQYREMGVRRVYFSSFTPLPSTPLENRPPAPLWREHRLYQLDWLLRVYRFSPRMLSSIFNDDGMLPHRDPKQALAELFLERPIDPNTASLNELLLVPGIGHKSAYRIIHARKTRPLTTLRQLHMLGVVLRRALPFLRLNGAHQHTLSSWVR